MTSVPLPPVQCTALLLDLDGTLLDLAATPDAVVVPPGLPDVLRTLRQLLHDALGIITGRPIETIDALLGDLPFAVAGEHGAAIRHSPHAALERSSLPAPPKEWLMATELLAAAHPGALFEPKSRGFTLHYRAVPSAREAFREALAGMLKDSEDFELLAGKMMWEVRPRGADKGKAVAALMQREPFRGRVPVFLGDDVTDEAAIDAATAMGGIGLRVNDEFGDAAGVRAWLRTIAAQGDWPRRQSGAP
jgi:trehalose 6-phosphate phosphatase